MISQEQLNSLKDLSNLTTSLGFTDQALYEQIIYVLFARLIGELDSKNRNTNPIFSDDLKHLRWEHIVAVPMEEQSRLFNGLPTRDEQKSWDKYPWMNMFQFYRLGLKNTNLKNFADCFKDSESRITNPQVLTKIIEFVQGISLKGEEVKHNFCQRIKSAIIGKWPSSLNYENSSQFTQLLLDLVSPFSSEDKICDFSCYDGSFLILAANTSQCLVKEPILGNQSNENIDTSDNIKLYGIENDTFWAKIASVNMLLNNITRISLNTISPISKQSDVFTKYENTFDKVIYKDHLFSIRNKNISKELLEFAKTDKPDILFLVLSEHILKIGGRGIVSVSNESLIVASTAEVRKQFIENNQIEAVIFIQNFRRIEKTLLVFNKGKTTDKVLFYKMVFADSFSDKTDLKTVVDDFLSVWEKWRDYRNTNNPDTGKLFEDNQRSFFYVLKEDIILQNYILTFEKYQKNDYCPEPIESPEKLLEDLKTQENIIIKILNQINSCF